MDNNEIKKALECCNTIGGCKVCPYSCYGKPTDNGECGEKMSLAALALITSQEQRIKELTEENERLRCEVADLKIIDKEYLPKEAIENRKEVRECKCGARFSAFVADKTDLLCAKCKHERGIIANEN